MNEEKEKILNFSLDKFLKEGFYKITMDEIASSLRMSKKTIYKNFPSKEELIKAAVFRFINTHSSNVNELMQEKSEAVKKFYNIIEYFGQVLMSFSERWMDDLQNTTKDLWLQIDEFRTKKMTLVLSKIIEQGKKEDTFTDVPNEIVIMSFISAIRGVVNPSFILHNKFTPKEALDYTIEILMNGIMTAKGKKIYKKYKNGAAK